MDIKELQRQLGKDVTVLVIKATRTMIVPAPKPVKREAQWLKEIRKRFTGP